MRRMVVTCGFVLFCLVISSYAQYSVPSGLGTLAVSALSSTAQNPRTAANAWVQTDKFDYQPGETALIAGGGFLPGEVVRLQVLHANGKTDGVGHDPFSTLTDLDGAISDQWYVHPDDSLHSLFILLAEGLTSGRRASAVFTDAFFYSPDDGGVDDINSNQVDLTRMGTDEVGLPNSLGIQFNWDDTSWTGGNSGDACALIDTDDPENGQANFALCVKVAGNPAVWVATSLYSCNDSRTDRCAGPTLIWNTLNGPPPAGSSTCSASIPLSSDPFTHGKGNVCNGANCATRDTVAACNVNMNDFGNANTAFLINVCTFPSGEPNSNPFDCVITPDNGFLTIVKAGPPAGDTTAFPFNLGTSQVSQNGTSQWTINGAGSQQNISFRPGTYDLKEAIPTNWKLDSASCEVSNAGTGTGTTTGVAGPANAGITGFQILSGRETTCTFTNSKQLAKLTLTKTVINNNGGTAGAGDFTLQIGTSVVGSGVEQQLSPGSYVLSETGGPAGYTPGSWSCSGFSNGGNFTIGTNTVTLVAGETVSCGITNDDQPAQLTVIKNVVNDNGGQLTASAFTMSVNGTNVSQSSFPGAAAPGTTVTLNAGTYSVDESPVQGYTKSLSADCSGTIANGQSKTCTITNNDDGATLIVIKKVTNDNGGTAVSSNFTMTIEGVTAAGGNSFPGADDPGTSKSLTTVGAYNVTETGPSGYDATYSADCSGTIALGQTKTCTITNDDTKASPDGVTVQRAILHDRLTMTGIRRGSGEGALSVTFKLYSDSGCNTQVGSEGPVNFVFDAPTGTSTSGSAQTSTGISVSATGTFYWVATFSGNNFNNAFTTKCGSEITEVKFTQ